MPRDWPDYGATAGAAPVYGVPDIGEVAVRLGAVSRWDRRGNLLFEETFEGSFHGWDINAGIDLGCTLALSPELSLFGLVSAKIGLAATPWLGVTLEKKFPLPTASPMGIEMAIRLPLNSSEVVIGVVHLQNSNYMQFRLKLDTLPDALSYLDSGGNWVELTPAPILSEELLYWSFLKIVYDPITGRYKRFIVNGREWQVTALGNTTPVAGEGLILTIEVYGLGGVADEAFIDGIVITTNEP